MVALATGEVMGHLYRSAASLCLALLILNSSFGQEAPRFRVQSELVLLRFHVFKKDRHIENLDVSEIEIRENGQPRSVAVFEGFQQRLQRTIPVHLAVVLDVSGSVTPYLPLTASLMQETVIQGLESNAVISIYAFGGETRHLAGPTRDAATLQAGVQEANGIDKRGSMVFGSLRQVCQDLGGGTDQRKVVIIFSDGLDTGTAHRGLRISRGQALRAARDGDIVIYPVCLTEAFRSNSDQMQAFSFAQLGVETGGRSFAPLVLTSETLREILQTVVWEQNMEYVAGYYAQPLSEPGKRKVKVVLKDRSRGQVRGGEKEL
ncbi:MAG: VWA domain-containing protein [Acidobacteria bacterium]|nr:MAG: VWA domain-containing protein [Acidobacteriota bacterium]